MASVSTLLDGLSLSVCFDWVQEQYITSLAQSLRKGIGGASSAARAVKKSGNLESLRAIRETPHYGVFRQTDTMALLVIALAHHAKVAVSNSTHVENLY